MSLSRALRRYISLPIASDQSAQLVPGLGGDTTYGPRSVHVLPIRERTVDCAGSAWVLIRNVHAA